MVLLCDGDHSGVQVSVGQPAAVCDVVGREGRSEREEGVAGNSCVAHCIVRCLYIVVVVPRSAHIPGN